MKKYCFVIALSALIMCGCGSKKKMMEQKLQEDVEVIVPCSGAEYMTSAEYFRVNALGMSNSLEIASQKAMTAARSKLAATIETTVKTVTDNYISSYEMGQQEEAKARFQSLTREVVNQQLSGVRVICQKTMKSKEGMYKYYVALELGKDDIAKAVTNHVSKEDKLRTDFEYEKFKKAFDDEMGKVGENQ